MSCRADACSRPVYGNGYCQRHYRRWYRTGTAADPVPRTRNQDRTLDDNRGEYGCILTFENAAGLTFVMHRAGRPTAIVPAMLDAALTLDPTFRLVAYSTPQTVFTDMNGSRHAEGYGRLNTRPTLPEAVILGRVKRREMLHPRLAA